MNEGDHSLVQWMMNGLFIILTGLGSFVLRNVHQRLNETEGQAERNTRRIIALEKTSLDEGRIRQIMAEHTAPINDTHRQIVDKLEGLSTQIGDLRVDLASHLGPESGRKK
ncbi:MAG: hypothetical protein CME59_22665 [Halioglobus sp.]|nr:hypothetical protein [Halioglobus sp.]